MLFVPSTFATFWILYELALGITDHNSVVAALIAAASVSGAVYLMFRTRRPPAAR